MMKAATIAEKRPDLELVIVWLIEMNKGISRLGLTKTRIPLEPSFQVSAICLSSFLTYPGTYSKIRSLNVALSIM